MSSFRPEDLMKKMGWSEGKGLGKNLQGIADPIRVVKKDDNSGVGRGYDHQDFAFWDALYAKASSNLTIQTTDEGVTIQADEKVEVNVVPIQYQGSFIKPVVSFASAFCETAMVDKCLVNKKIRSKGKIARLTHVETNGHSVITSAMELAEPMQEPRTEKLSKSERKERRRLEKAQDKAAKKLKKKEEKRQSKSEEKKKRKASLAEFELLEETHQRTSKKKKICEI